MEDCKKNIQETYIQSTIARMLHMDKSYLSRLVKRFEQKGLLEKVPSKEDKRAAPVALTEKGRRETERLIALTNCQIWKKIEKLNKRECKGLCAAFDTVIKILRKGEEKI